MPELLQSSKDETTPSQGIQAKAPDTYGSISRRGFFTRISHMFGKLTPEDKITDQAQKPTRLDRREFVKRAAAVATVAFSGHLIRNNDTLNDLVVDKMLANINEPLAANVSKDADALDAYAKTVTEYKGPIHFDVPQYTEVGDTNWTDDEYLQLTKIIEDNKVLLADIFGEPAIWTNNETVFVIQDFIRYLARHEQAGFSHAVFIDGDALSKSILSNERQKEFKKINILCIPKDFISPNADDPFAMSPENARGYIGHEMTHAFNQDFDYLPVMVYEGMAQMTFYKNSETYWKLYHVEHLNSTEEEADAFAFELLKDNNAGDVENAKKADISKTFRDIGKFNPSLQASYYRAAGYLFYQWHREHPDFFRSLRKKENKLYTETGKKPTFEEWLLFGEEISPGFKSWLGSYPMFSIKA